MRSLYPKFYYNSIFMVLDVQDNSNSYRNYFIL